MESHRHLELAARDDLAVERGAREVGVLEVEVIRQQRAVQAPRSGGEFHRLCAENLVLVLGRELAPFFALAPRPSPGDHRPAQIIVRSSQRARQGLAELAHHPRARLLL